MDPKFKTKTPPKGGGGLTARPLHIVLAIFTALVVIAVAIVAIIAMVFNSNANALQRYCLVSNEVLGSVSTDVNDRTVAWEMQYLNSMGIIISVHIMGPIPLGVTQGPLDFALCGSPATLACDLTTPNQLKGLIEEYNPGGLGLKSIIQAIRLEPWRFYVQLTGSNATVRMPMTSICGTAN